MDSRLRVCGVQGALEGDSLCRLCLVWFALVFAFGIDVVLLLLGWWIDWGKQQQLKHLTSVEAKVAKKREKTVSRAYGGSRCAHCVKTRVVRAFLIEEQKIVKAMLQEKLKKSRK